MNTRKLLCYLLTALLGGCIPVMSLHPLFTEKSLVFEEKLLGTWVDDPNCPKTTWEFKRIADSSEKDRELPPEVREKAYKLIYSDDEGKKGSFFAGLAVCFDRHFLNVIPSQFPCAQMDPNEDWTYNTFFWILGHSFIMIDSIEPKLKMRRTVNDEMKKLLKEDPNVVKHVLVEDRVILTASTKELQAFILKYADDERLFANEIILSRKKTQDQNVPVKQDPNDSSKEK